MTGASQMQSATQPPTSLAPVQPPSALPAITNPMQVAQEATRRVARRPGRPAVYVFDKPDDQLTEKERKRKRSIEKRRERQNRSYHRRKKLQRDKATTESGLSQPQVVPDVVFSSPLRGQPGMPAVVPRSDNSPWQQTPTPAPPPLIPGFAQNPLDLLANATATGTTTPSITFSGRSSTVKTHDALGDTSSFAASESKDSVDTDRVSARPMFNYRNVAATAPQSADTAPVPNVVEDTDTLEIDATAGAMDMNPFAFGPAEPKEGEEDEEATDVLVNSALVAAKEYANNAVSLKDVMDRENELRRMTGIKQIVFDNLRIKYMSMDSRVQSALRHFVIFPRTFNLRAAASVAGLQEAQLVVMQGMLESMIQSNFIITSKGRYELNEAARLFLNEDQTVFNDNITGNTYDVAQKRFVKHYQSQLSRLQDDNIHKVGWLREQAMALYDSERENMVFSEYLLKGRNDNLREFLSAGITVMRYCVRASDREKVLRKALMDDETSTEEILLPFTGSSSFSETTSTAGDEKKQECDKSHRARLQLALSEACFDQLKMEEAEQPLLRALKLMGEASPICQGTASAGIVDRVLVLLLLSNLRLGANRIKEARSLCIKALNILKEANLGRSTFGINAMSNLVTIYLYEGHLPKAKSVANRLLDTLNTMRYTGMPIYADALGVCAMVSMAEGNYAEAERQYGTALETVGKWGSKEWTGVPVQHCLDLDLWLMEGFAEAVRRQGRIEEAKGWEQRANEVRNSRGLPRNVNAQDFLNIEQEASRAAPVLESRSTVRHLY